MYVVSKFLIYLPLFGSIADKRPWLPTTMQSCVPSLFVSTSRQLCLDGSLMKGLLQLSVPSETFIPIKPGKSFSCLCSLLWAEYEYSVLVMVGFMWKYPLTNKLSSSLYWESIRYIGWLRFGSFVIFLLTIWMPPVKTERTNVAIKRTCHGNNKHGWFNMK